MKKVLLFVLFAAMQQGANAQQQTPMGPPVLVQEAQAGDVVCVMSRQYGQPSILTFSVYGSVDLSKLTNDINKCAAEVRKKFAEIDKPAIQKKT